MREGQGRWSLKLVAAEKMQSQRNPGTVKENERQEMMETEVEIPRKKKDTEMRESGDKQKETKKRETDAKRNRHRESGRKMEWGRDRNREKEILRGKRRGGTEKREIPQGRQREHDTETKSETEQEDRDKQTKDIKTHRERHTFTQR